MLTLKSTLLAGYNLGNPDTGMPIFAFRLHQFISRGDTVYASLEAEDNRYITVNGQKFVPNDRNRALFPLVFCRECGQEYYLVRKVRSTTDVNQFVPGILQIAPMMKKERQVISGIRQQTPGS
jgi:hypothetical protein